MISLAIINCFLCGAIYRFSCVFKILTIPKLIFRIVPESIGNVSDVLPFLKKALSFPFHFIIMRYFTVWLNRVEFHGEVCEVQV